MKNDSFVTVFKKNSLFIRETPMFFLYNPGGMC